MIALRKKVLIQGIKLKENKSKESIVHLYFSKDCLEKGKYKFSQLKVHSSYIFSEKEIYTFKKDSGMKFPKHLKVKLTKKFA